MSEPPQQKLEDLLPSRINSIGKSSFISELLTNSGHFLFLEALSEIALHGWWNYFTQINHYLIIGATLLQAWYLARKNAHRFWGNLIAPAIYMLTALPVDGLNFFQEPNHIVFWVFALIIAIFQELRFLWATSMVLWIVFLEYLARTFILVVFYITLNFKEVQQPFNLIQILEFSGSASHRFLMLSMGFVGLLLGLQALELMKQRRKLKETVQLLHHLAEWGLGSHVVATAVNNPEALAFHRCDRTIVFIDIRSFTSWCEQKPTEEVAIMLNSYYRNVELAAAEYYPLRLTFTGDEVMAIYATPQQGVAAAQSMLAAAQQAIACCGIGVGCGVHCGSVIEGLFGGKDVRTYTVIGDVVNTAKRLESATPAGAITLSNAIYQVMHQQLTVEPCKPIAAKGKTETLIAWRLAEVHQ
jgi:adenylate cyclase